jgi:hypothetical protein
MISKTAQKALNKIGDVLIPQNGEFPSFSQTQCVENVNDITNYAPEEDIALLNLVLTFLSFAPQSIIHWLINKMDKSYEMEEPLGTIFRQLNFGLRGIIFGLYYGEKTKQGKSPLDIIEFRINRI